MTASLRRKAGQLPLQGGVEAQGAVEKTGSRTAAAELLNGVDSGLFNFFVGGQAQVVVGSQHDAAFAFHDYFHILMGLELVEVGVKPHSLIP